MSTLYRGTAPVEAIYRGAQPVNSIYRGATLLWTGAPIFDGFDGSGWLSHWINELLSEDPLALISDVLGQLWNGLNALVGSTVAFVQGGENQLGQLVTHSGTALVDAYCAAWGGTTPEGGGATPTPDGLLGLLNGVPLIGPYLSAGLSQIINLVNGAESVVHLVGTIPVLGNLAVAMGLIANTVTGAIGPPINFVIDQLGNVIGTITCGAYRPTAASVAADIQYVIGQVNQRARMLIPPGLLSLDTRTSRYRWPTPLTSDDGYLEVRLADAGSGHGMKTQVFRRYSDSGYHQGTGIQFLEGSVSLVHRVGDGDVLVAPGVTSCQGGDRFRLTQAGSTHTLMKNGHTVSTVNGIAAPGAGSRSVGMLMMGGKELVGPIQHSAALDYLEAA